MIFMFAVISHIRKSCFIWIFINLILFSLFDQFDYFCSLINRLIMLFNLSSYLIICLVMIIFFISHLSPVAGSIVNYFYFLILISPIILYDFPGDCFTCLIVSLYLLTFGLIDFLSLFTLDKILSLLSVYVILTIILLVVLFVYFFIILFFIVILLSFYISLCPSLNSFSLLILLNDMMDLPNVFRLFYYHHQF